VETEEIKPPTNPDVESVICYRRNLEKQNKAFAKKIMLIILIGTTANCKPRPSSKASAVRLYSLQHSFFSPNYLASPKRSGS
jgi:hypothetical protein